MTEPGVYRAGVHTVWLCRCSHVCWSSLSVPAMGVVVVMVWAAAPVAGDLPLIMCVSLASLSIDFVTALRN